MEHQHVDEQDCIVYLILLFTGEGESPECVDVKQKIQSCDTCEAEFFRAFPLIEKEVKDIIEKEVKDIKGDLDETVG